MTVTTDKSTEYTQLYITKPMTPLNTTEWHGVVRIAYFTTNQSGTGDATSNVALVKLPPGRVRVLLPSSHAYVNWVTGSATLDLGWDAYVGLDGVTVVADPDGLVDGMDVDTVGIRQLSTGAPAAIIALGYAKVLESKDGDVIRTTSQDVAMVASDDLVGYIAYVMD